MGWGGGDSFAQTTFKKNNINKKRGRRRGGGREGRTRDKTHPGRECDSAGHRAGRGGEGIPVAARVPGVPGVVVVVVGLGTTGQAGRVWGPPQSFCFPLARDRKAGRWWCAPWHAGGRALPVASGRGCGVCRARVDSRARKEWRGASSEATRARRGSRTQQEKRPGGRLDGCGGGGGVGS